jgi:predicted Zn-dependent protease with MMP-like domain
VTSRERARFDRLLEVVIGSLPRRLADLLEEAPVVVDDRPSARLMRELDVEHPDELCGLHSGTPLTERSVAESLDLPETIHLFREGIVAQAGGWEEYEEDGELLGGEEAIAREIRITLLHEIGHHFGLEERDLEGLGYE